ncbi:undecaprenyl-diphosphatase [Thermocladium modestius]|uniref:Undecaprenyl-diphosphatase n=2 Tax=Thermocladium modestius TaxID=62609 RepID=A0A830GWK5_9CREN|nr:undecaprenyl-diphosphatase [Thermocladium modestius]
MEIGTIFAAMAYFRSEIYMAILALFGRGGEQGLMLLKYIIVSTIVTGLLGVPLYIFIVNSIKGPVVGVPMLMLGLALIIDGLVIRLSRKSRSSGKSLKDLTIRDFIMVGLAQGLAALPGVSRSGMTTSALLFLGVKPDEAFRLSFIELIPAALGAIGATLILSRHMVEGDLHFVGVNALGFSIMAATIVSLFLIDALLRFARSNRVIIVLFTLGALAVISGLASIIIGAT